MDRVDRKELCRALAAVIERMERDFPEELSLTRDYYWSVPEEQRYNPLHDPQIEQMTLGQVSYDWERLRSVTDASEVLPQVLRWSAAVLEALSYEAVVEDALLRP